MEDNEKSDEQLLSEAERYIEEGQTDLAQYTLKRVKENSGKKHFLQSKTYQQKQWYNEQYKELKAAIKAEPNNHEYKIELSALKKSFDYKQSKAEIREMQMGKICNSCWLDCSNCTCY